MACMERLRSQGLGIRVWGLVFGVEGLGFGFVIPTSWGSSCCEGEGNERGGNSEVVEG